MILNIIKTNKEWLEATWKEEDEIIYCESFSGHKEHIEMLKNKCVEFDIKLDKEQLKIIDEISKAYIYPTEEEIALEELKHKLQEYQTYLDNTDYKDLPRYKPKDDEDIEAIYSKRDEYREFIRANKAKVN